MYKLSDSMIKAKDIKKIEEEHKEYIKLLKNETNTTKQLEYKLLVIEYEYKLMDIELQLLNIELGLHKDEELYKNIFIDKYINKIPVERLVDKYRISRTKIYKVINKAKDLFESKRYLNSLIL